MQKFTNFKLPVSRGFFFFLPCFPVSCRLRLLCLLLILLAQTARAQDELWEASFGGSADDALSALQPSRDGGYILGGTSKSNQGGDKSQDNRGECMPDEDDPQVSICPTDFWVVKVDSLGKKQWDKTFGGLENDDLAALVQSPDGGYLLGGTSVSGKGGDKSQAGRGGADFWIIRLDADGNKLWDKTLGGERHDQLTVLKLTSDGGFIVGGYSNSGIGADKTETTRAGCPAEKTCTPDFWVLKFDAAGNKQWDITLGGRAEDILQTLHQTPDGGYALAGISWSGIGGNKTAVKKGRADYWLVKIDARGQKTWDQSYGSEGRELLQDMQLTSDGGYILGGYISQGQSGDITGIHHGDSDFWVIKVDGEGNKVWDKTFGGRDPDYFKRLQLTSDGGYLLLGQSYSVLGGDKTWKRNGPWVIRLDSLGNKQWDKIFGGGFKALEPTRDGNFILGGNTAESGFIRDYYILKITAEAQAPALTFNSFSPDKGLPGSRVILKGENMFKTASVWFYGDKLKKAKYSVVDNHTILAVVPPAAKTGAITLYSREDTVVSTGIFKVLQPTLTLLSPDKGQEGTAVQLRGKNLISTIEVYFNGVAANNFKVASNEQVIAVVPGGATTGRLTLVLAGGRRVISEDEFTILPDKTLAGAKLNQSLQQERAERPDTGMSEGLARLQVYPNPFQGQVTLQFSLNQTLSATVIVFDLLGREVKELFRQEAREGEKYQAIWRPSDRQAAGVYYIRLQTAAGGSQQRVMLEK